MTTVRLLSGSSACLAPTAILLFLLTAVGCDSGNFGSDDDRESPPHVTVSVTGPDEIHARAEMTYEIVVENAGGDATQVKVTSSVPDGAIDVSASNGGTFSGQTVSWPVIDVLPGSESRTYTVSLIAARSGRMSSTSRAEWIGKSGALQDFETETKTWITYETIDTLEPTYGAFGTAFGEFLVRLGDVNGDGVGDFAVSEWGTTLPWLIHIYSGSSRQILSTISPSYPFLFDMINAGDVNGDGVDDIVAGVPSVDNPGTGEILFFSGVGGGRLMTVTDGEGGHDFGYSLDAAGDVNNDGFDDIIASDPSYQDPGVAHGRVYVFSGRDGLRLNAFGLPPDIGPNGWAVSAAGDLSGDGVGDIAVSSGAHLMTISGSDGATLLEPFRWGVTTGLLFGLSSPGDVDGDGVNDLFVGDIYDQNTGAAHVFSGRTGGEIHTFVGESEGDAFGDGHPIGDIDGDGISDLVICAWNNDARITDGGKLYFFSGRDGSIILEFEGTDLRGRIGLEAIQIDDVNGDGLDDFLVSTGQAEVFIMAGVPE